MEVDIEWLWKILWTDETHFHLTGYVHTYNCRIWTTENPLETLPVPLHPAKITVWCGFIGSFILGPYFFEETDALGPATVTITGQRHECLFFSHVIPALQQRGCVNRIILMRSSAYPVKQLLKRHFGNAKIISLQFPIAWPSRSPNLSRVTSGCGVIWKIFCSVIRIHT